MSASRPKLAKPKAKPRPFTVEDPQLASARSTASPVPASAAPKPRPKAPAAAKKKLAATPGRIAEAAAARRTNGGGTSSSVAAKGKGKVNAVAGPSKPRRPLGTASEPEVLSSGDSSDDFEEVPIPTTPGARAKSQNASAGPSSPYPYSAATPTTPGTNVTARNTPAATTAGETDEDPYAEDDDEEEEGDGVIRLEIGGETPEEKAKRIALALRKKPMTSKDRILRITIHKMHVISLLANARIRNKWASNMLLKGRLLSLLPHPLVAAFSIPPSRFPDRAQRARLFVDALQSLVLWWTQTFFDIPDTTIGQRTRPWDEVQEIVDKLPRLSRQDFLPGGPLLDGGKSDKEKEKEEQERLEKYGDGANGERLRTVNSLMKKALQQEGSRDVSAILFVALCRACGLGARLVVSLQAVPWRAEKVVVKKPSGAGKGGRSVASRQGQGTADEDADSDESMEEVPIPGKEEDEEEEGEGGPGEIMEKIKNKKIRGAGRRRQQDPADVYRLRKPKPAPQTVGAKPKVKTKQDLGNQPPVIWAEVFSRPDQKWFPVDPTRGTVRKKGHFEPQSDNGPIRMTYVVAFEEDGFARDVTLRYTKSFGAKTAKLRAPQRKDEPDWWEGVLGFLARPYRLNRDDLEDAELENSQISEAMPVHMNGFKDHPLFVLERHLKREEVIQPKREVGKFRGESVYRRANVLSCKTAESWMRVGRKVKDRQEPMKWVKQRAMTINKKREVELAKQAGEDVMQGLYAEGQTMIYRPPPIQDGKIPQNAFGNIDLYAPTMLPQGAAHLAYKGIAKVAKQLGVSYAEACTGFEFKKQRAIPTITGIVVPEESAEAVMDAYWASTAAAEEREKQKRIDKALKRWGKLINALRVRERLRATYGDKEGLHDQSHNPLAEADADGNDKSKAKGKRSAANVLAQANQEASTAWADRARDKSESPPAREDALPEVAVQDFATGEVGLKSEPAGDSDDEEEDDDMEEVDVDGAQPAGPISPDLPEQIPSAASTPRPPYVPVEVAPPVRPSRRSAREAKSRLAVDNPYESSDEDDEKAVVSDASIHEVDDLAAGDDEDEDSGDSMAEVDFTPKEPTPLPAAPQTTRSGRTIKLRIGPVKEAEPEEKAETSSRVTRSSKRKR